LVARATRRARTVPPLVTASTPSPLGRRGQAPRQPGGIEDGALVRGEPSREVRRGVDESPDRGGVEEPVPVGLERRDLVGAGGDGQRPAAGEPAVDAVALHGLLDLVEVAQPEAVQVVVLRGPAGAAVELAVGQARLAEAAVAAGGVLGDPVGLDEQDTAPRRSLHGTERGPQPGEAPADDEQVGLDVRVEGGSWHRAVRGVEPQRPEHRALEGAGRPRGPAVLHVVLLPRPTAA
jgi:hypothetical protein